MNTNKNLHQSAKKQIGSLTLFSLLIIMFSFIFQNSAHAGNKLIEGMKLKQGGIKSFTLFYNKKRQQLHVIGTMEIGILPAFKNMLQKHPELKTVAFNSSGGNVYQARGLAKMIESMELNTFVSEDCYSACTIAFVAGKMRYMSPKGKLGFHQYNMKSKMLNPRYNLEKEQAKDLTYFKSKIPDRIFLKKIFNAKNTDIWVPEHQDLLMSGVIHEIAS